MTSLTYKKTRPLFGFIVIAVSATSVAAVGGMLWFGVAVLAALAFAYLLAVSTPELSTSTPSEAPSKLKYVVFLAAFIAALLAVFVGRNYPFIPWPDEVGEMSATQVQALVRAYRTLLFGVCTLFAVAYLHIVLLILGYVRQQRKTASAPAPRASAPSAAI
jgi:hypothetical protein